MLRGEFEKLLHILRPESSMDKADLQLLKDKVFGPQTFFVTESRLTDDFSPDAGWLVSALLSLQGPFSACSACLGACHNIMHASGLPTFESMRYHFSSCCMQSQHSEIAELYRSLQRHEDASVDTWELESEEGRGPGPCVGGPGEALWYALRSALPTSVALLLLQLAPLETSRTHCSTLRSTATNVLHPMLSSQATLCKFCR